MKKKLVLLAASLILAINMNAQPTDLAPNYKVYEIGDNGYGDYTRSLILLHEVYNGVLINKNFAIGTLKAMRGHSSAFDRTDVAQINSSSSYNGIHGSVISSSTLGLKWALKTAIYNGKKYLALEVPYTAAFHNWGFQFVGWTSSTGESMKCISYEVNGQPIAGLSDIQDFVPTMNEVHDVSSFAVNCSATIKGVLGIYGIGLDGSTNQTSVIYSDINNGLYFDAPLKPDGNGLPINFAWRGSSPKITFLPSGNVGIGTTSPQNKLDVAGTIHAKEVKVDLTGWSDFVFAPTYKLKPLSEVEQFIKMNGHLPAIPSAKEVEQNGVNVGDMQAKLLQKVEELTLYVIELKKENEQMKKENEKIKQDIVYIKNKQ